MTGNEKEDTPPSVVERTPETRGGPRKSDTTRDETIGALSKVVKEG